MSMPMCPARSKGSTISQRIGARVSQSALTGAAPETHNVPIFHMVTSALRRHWPPILLFVGLLVAWQLAVSVLRIREYLLPSPWAVLRAVVDFRIPWWTHLWVTSAEIVGAFLLAGMVGVLLGAAIAWSPAASSAPVPFLVFVNTLPKVAVAPLFLLWLGYGIVPNMLIGALIGFFPVVINTAVGLTQVDAEMLDLGRVFGAPKWKVFLTIRIPNAFPYILRS